MRNTPTSLSKAGNIVVRYLSAASRLCPTVISAEDCLHVLQLHSGIYIVTSGLVCRINVESHGCYAGGFGWFILLWEALDGKKAYSTM